MWVRITAIPPSPMILPTIEISSSVRYLTTPMGTSGVVVSIFVGVTEGAGVSDGVGVHVIVGLLLEIDT